MPQSVTKHRLSALGEEHISRVVSRIVNELIGKEVSKDEPLMAAGLDSLSGLELKSSLGDAFSLQLPNTLVYDYSSVQGLAEYIHTLLSNERADVQISSSPSNANSDVHLMHASSFIDQVNLCRS